MIYVPHVCRSSRQPEHFPVMNTEGKKELIPNPEYCDRIWIDKDLTGATFSPPTWKYCEDCCKRLGIDYDKQTPTSNLSEKELASRNNRVEKMKKAREKKKETSILH
jgi:hypothetical protein